MTNQNQTPNDIYPSGDEVQSQIARRHNWGKLWRTLFLLATVLAVVVLTVLLINIINQSFGLTAVQEEIPKQVLII